MARPSPRLPPVISARLPSRRNLSKTLMKSGTLCLLDFFDRSAISRFDQERFRDDFRNDHRNRLNRLILRLAHPLLAPEPADVLLQSQDASQALEMDTAGLVLNVSQLFPEFVNPFARDG